MRNKLAIGALTVTVGFLLATNPVVVNAAGQITGAQIKNNSVASKDIKNNSLKGGDVKDGGLTGADLEDNSLKGTDVDESSLGPVPSATTATTATTAANATTLNGQPASAYQDQAITVALSPSAAVSNFTKNLPAIPNGTYEVNMNVSADLSGPNSFSCLIARGATSLVHQYGAPYSGNFYSINASRVVNVTGPLNIFCTVNAGTFSSPSFVHPPNQISFVPVDTTTSAGTASRGGDQRPAAGGASN